MFGLQPDLAAIVNAVAGGFVGALLAWLIGYRNQRRVLSAFGTVARLVVEGSINRDRFDVLLDDNGWPMALVFKETVTDTTVASDEATPEVV